MFVWVVFLIYLLNLWWLEFVDVIGFIVVWSGNGDYGWLWGCCFLGYCWLGDCGFF